MRRLIPALAMLSLAAACQRHEPGPQERVDLSGPPPLAVQHVIDSPDTSRAVWTVERDGRAVDFGNPGGPAMLTLACRLGAGPPHLAIIRHVPARPGLTALFAVIGNGMKVRFKVASTLRDGEWRWEGVLPADDPELEVFTGPHELKATLPGGGTLDIAGSHIPGEFVSWCHAGGHDPMAREASGKKAPVSRSSRAR